MSFVWVTAFYDLSKYDPHRSRNIDFYLQKGTALKKLKGTLVIFTEEDLVSKIQDLFTKSTCEIIIKIRPFTELEYYPKIDRVKECYSHFQTGSPHKDTVNYILLMWFKFPVMLEVMREYSEADSYSWIDFGISHIAKMDHMEEVYPCLIDKVRVTCLNGFTWYNINNNFRNRIHGYTAGGFFGGSSLNLIQVCKRCMNKIEVALKEEFIINDQEVLTWVIQEYPQLFELHYGEYDEIFENLPYQRSIDWRVGSSLNRYRGVAPEKTKHLCERYLYSYLQNKIKDVRGCDMAFITFEYIVALRIDNIEEARKWGNFFLDKIDEFEGHFKNNASTIYPILKELGCNDTIEQVYLKYKN